MRTAPHHLPKKVTEKPSVNHIGSSDEPPIKRIKLKIYKSFPWHFSCFFHTRNAKIPKTRKSSCVTARGHAHRPLHSKYSLCCPVSRGVPKSQPVEVPLLWGTLEMTGIPPPRMNTPPTGTGALPARTGVSPLPFPRLGTNGEQTEDITFLMLPTWVIII